MFKALKMWAVPVIAALAAIGAQGAELTGKIQLKYSESAFDDDAVFTQTFGHVVKAECRWYAGDFFGKETVFAGVEVKNTGTKPMFYQYFVAFFDKAGKLVGCASQGSFGDDGLAPGKETHLGSCLIHLPKDKYKEIASFQALLYETDKAPEKKTGFNKPIKK